MPVYVYQCSNCEVEFEQSQKFSDPPLKRCPECGQNTLHKVYSPVGVIYKGSGFYSTDHRSSSGATSTPAQKKKEEKSTEKKSEPVKEKSAKKEE